MPDLWRTEPQSVLSAEVDGFRLIVHAPEKIGGLVRFTVLRRTREGPQVLMGSGSQETVSAAMAAAERMVETRNKADDLRHR